MRRQPPGRTRPKEVENGVDQLARGGLSRSPAEPRIRDHGRDQVPLAVGQIGIVAPPHWRLSLRHRAAARVVGPTPYESCQSRLGNPSQTRSKAPRYPERYRTNDLWVVVSFTGWLQ